MGTTIDEKIIQHRIMWKDIFRVLLKQWIMYTFGNASVRQGTGCGGICHTGICHTPPSLSWSSAPPPPVYIACKKTLLLSCLQSYKNEGKQLDEMTCTSTNGIDRICQQSCDNCGAVSCNASACEIVSNFAFFLD